jgi:hypothetical protein
LRKPIIGSLFLTAFLAAQSKGPDRTVAENVITSERDPAVRIELPKTVHYLGVDRWVLYGIADCELHAFVQTDQRKHVQRLYWVQFEGYIPSRPELHHTYDSLRHADVGGLNFYVDTWVRSKDEKIDSGSDREHIERLIHTKGYTMPPGMAYVRFVHLLDAERRKELMVIYGEDLAPSGLSADDVKEAGKAHAQWPAIERRLVDDAEKQIRIEPAPR